MARLLMLVNGAGGPFTTEIAQLKTEVANLDAFLDHVADTIIYPALARNYDQSGLKVHRGVVKAAVSKRGAKGNVIEIRNGHLTISVDTAAVPEAEWAINGRPGFQAKRGKTLRFFDDNGKPIFAKRVKAARPHEVFHLNDGDIAKIQAAAVEWVENGG